MCNKKNTDLMNILMAALIVGSLGMVNMSAAEASALAIDDSAMIMGCRNADMVNMVNKAVKDMSIIDKTTVNLKALNTMRGGKNGFTGFVGEHLEAQAASLEGKATTVVNDNGLLD